MRTLVVSVEESSFIKGLDLAPGDGALRYVYADWLGESGRDRESALQRWLGDTGRYPACNLKGGPFHLTAGTYGTPLQWGWKSDYGSRYEGQHYCLPVDVGYTLNRTEKAHYPYPTRRGAELALLNDGVWLTILKHGKVRET